MNFNLRFTDATSLCSKCQWGQVTERRNGDKLVYCNDMCRFVPPDVIKCNSFREYGTPSDHDMEKIAWTIKADRYGKVIGFEAPKKKDD
jgi:hypothetical protein